MRYMMPYFSILQGRKILPLFFWEGMEVDGGLKGVML